MRGADLSKKYCSSIQYLFILGVFTLCHSGAASLTGATKSWLKRVVAVSALTRESTLCYVNNVQSLARAATRGSALRTPVVAGGGREAVHGKDELSARADAAGDRQG